MFEIWKEVEKLVHYKMAMVVGVADFNTKELAKLYDQAEILPRINQVKSVRRKEENKSIG